MLLESNPHHKLVLFVSHFSFALTKGISKQARAPKRGGLSHQHLSAIKLYEGGLKSKFRFVINFLFFIVHT